MSFRCRVNSLALSLSAIIWLVTAIGISEAQASCGNYLHTRFGPPPQQSLRIPANTPAVFSHSNDGWKDRTPGSPLPLPCSGPNCGRSSAPPVIPPAIPGGSSDGPPEGAPASADVLLADNAARWDWLPPTKLRLPRISQLIDVPPEC